VVVPVLAADAQDVVVPVLVADAQDVVALDDLVDQVAVALDDLVDQVAVALDDLVDQVAVDRRCKQDEDLRACIQVRLRRIAVPLTSAVIPSSVQKVPTNFYCSLFPQWFV
jgi:hypothetical protein